MSAHAPWQASNQLPRAFFPPTAAEQSNASKSCDRSLSKWREWVVDGDAAFVVKDLSLCSARSSKGHKDSVKTRTGSAMTKSPACLSSFGATWTSGESTDGCGDDSHGMRALSSKLEKTVETSWVMASETMRPTDGTSSSRERRGRSIFVSNVAFLAASRRDTVAASTGASSMLRGFKARSTIMSAAALLMRNPSSISGETILIVAPQSRHRRRRISADDVTKRPCCQSVTRAARAPLPFIARPH